MYVTIFNLQYITFSLISLIYSREIRGIFFLLKAVLNEFIYECKIKNLSPRTIKSYYSSNDLMVQWLIDNQKITDIEQVKTTDLKAYIFYKFDNNAKETYINGIIKNMRAFFKYAIDNEYIANNPVLKVRWAKEAKPIIKTFTSKQAVQLLLEIKAYDCMLNFEKSFKNTLSSGTPFDFFSIACENCHVPFAHTRADIEAMPNGKFIYGIYGENDIESCRDLLFYTAQVLGCYCQINREGKLELRKYGDNPVLSIVPPIKS